MKFHNAIASSVLVLSLMAPLALAPAVAGAQSKNTVERRQKTKNDWRNLALGSGGLAILGLIKKDSTLTFVGSAGALYSAYRYEQDRKSQSKLARTRAAYFSKPYFYRDGVRYDRKVKYVNGKKNYYFAKNTKYKAKNVPKGRALGWHRKNDDD